MLLRQLIFTLMALLGFRIYRRILLMIELLPLIVMVTLVIKQSVKLPAVAAVCRSERTVKLSVITVGLLMLGWLPITF
ncbi:MAG: hypothetical protein COV08_03430 [Candidatus Vogelbacteria bacterium CG10_big_fil_rev_8_21_14_0_10_49_38]|uniref:Uncharacterized protein n=1 Tax=Candidatus Vogelbacteria bacterium CG10_big_fil_rev_8_21_14_0_10_49_38 TaxID=1975043 RepID=A0A2H0RH09_9BACT|nr:MAG: hypothetical protein BK006_03420 [bacterium CG10_49_38]PIR45696.1 MAG: hypothetical protein COV08_03430 [Candidatus Vogelbacteria bacterium CG10_big_fil_rev_8_21_14_0_10_49_38]